MVQFSVSQNGICVVVGEGDNTLDIRADIDLEREKAPGSYIVV